MILQIIAVIIFIARAVVSIISSYQLVGCRPSFKYYYCLDMIMVCTAGVVIAAICLTALLDTSNGAAWAIMAIYGPHYLIASGNFRVMMKNCDWSCCQVILYKLVLIFVTAVYVLFGSVMFLVDISQQFPEENFA